MYARLASAGPAEPKPPAGRRSHHLPPTRQGHTRASPVARARIALCDFLSGATPREPCAFTRLPRRAYPVRPTLLPPLARPLSA
eukprot:scaffold25568_cov63-Phaeocystis_antarctica.AAC.1